MGVFASADFDNHEQVTFCHDEATGLKAIIAIHNTHRGPSLGGCRMWPYASEDEALTDVLRLSRGMTYKSAMANLALGGGKSVIIGDAAKQKTGAMMRAMGRFVDSLGGRYIIAEDVGTKPADMNEIAKETAHVKGTSNDVGDPSPATALGVFEGLKATVRERMGTDDIAGLRVIVQGLGAVGYDLARQLADAGADLVVSDINAEALARAERELGARIVAPDAIFGVEADVYAPCALGSTLNDDSIPKLKVKAVAGSANNQLAEARHGALLAKREILYAPDYVINAGGVIYISHTGPAFDETRALAHVRGIGGTLTEIFRRARQDRVTPGEAADRIAEERFRLAPSVAA